MDKLAKRLKLAVFALTLLLAAGCGDKKETGESESHMTIRANEKSSYTDTFNDLHLGVLFDFDFTLPEADKRWVNLWVERYIDGKKDSEPLTELSYGESPNNKSQGSLGFGIINSYEENPLVFLYGPGVTANLAMIDKDYKDMRMSGHEYAVSGKKEKLAPGETKILAVYRETAGDSMRTYDLTNEEDIEQLIEEETMVMLLKLKVTEIDN